MSTPVLGIDLSVNPRDTGVCELTFEDGRWISRIERATGARSRDALVARIVDTLDAGGRVAIDSPFGWPEAWLRLLASSEVISSEIAVPQHHEGKAGIARSLRWRRTDAELFDLRLQGGGTGEYVTPLSASTDKLAATTARCLEILVLVAASTGADVARDGTSRIFEVYPGASLAVWGLPRTKGPQGRAIQHAAFRDRCVDLGLVLDSPAYREHDLDALVAALTIVGGSRPVPDGAAGPQVAQEGVIHLPARPLDAILTPPRSAPGD